MTKRARLLCLLIAGLICQGTMAASARTAFFISDLHVGAGKQADGQWRRIEDFRWQSDLDAFLIWADAQAKGQADLVLVGDVFELWQSPFMTCSSDVTKSGCVVPDCSENDTEVGCSEVEALARLSYTLKQHADFIGAIRAFAAHGDNRVYFIPGNHDAALLFDTVRQSLLDQLGSEHISVLASGFWLSADGRVYADHGHQFDDVNTFKEWPTPFVTKDGVLHGSRKCQEIGRQQDHGMSPAERHRTSSHVRNAKVGLHTPGRRGFQRSSVAPVAPQAPNPHHQDGQPEARPSRQNREHQRRPRDRTSAGCYRGLGGWSRRKRQGCVGKRRGLHHFLPRLNQWQQQAHHQQNLTAHQPGARQAAPHRPRNGSGQQRQHSDLQRDRGNVR